eukprot:scaffold76003_cov19-Tisochrysis_lutea.AAC.2
MPASLFLQQLMPTPPFLSTLWGVVMECFLCCSCSALPAVSFFPVPVRARVNSRRCKMNGLAGVPVLQCIALGGHVLLPTPVAVVQ